MERRREQIAYDAEIEVARLNEENCAIKTQLQFAH